MLIGMPRRVATAWLLTITLGLAPWAGAIAEEKPMERTISVSGSGQISTAPDLADINIGVVTQAQTARDALSANNESMQAIHDLLKERGVASKDIQTVNINVSPRYSQPSPSQPGQQREPFVPRIVGYEVTNTVQITARDLEKLGSILDAVVQSGANQIHGISFRIAEPEKLLDEARKRAVADARRKAEQLAGEAGVVVGLPISINESGGVTPPPRPMAATRMMAAESAVPVAGGEQELTIDVSIVFELKPAE